MYEVKVQIIPHRGNARYASAYLLSLPKRGEAMVWFFCKDFDRLISGTVERLSKVGETYFADTANTHYIVEIERRVNPRTLASEAESHRQVRSQDHQVTARQRPRGRLADTIRDSDVPVWRDATTVNI